MPLTAKDFKIYNSTPQYVKQLDQAFDYFRAKFPDNADSALQYLHDNNKAFMNNGPGNPYVNSQDVGADLYGHYDGRDVILWNPATGILVTVNNKVTGIQSAADGLAHEIWGHALNPANDAMGNIPDTQYRLQNEHVATDIESTINAVFFGEPLRDSWDGKLVWTSDVTVRTIMTEDGALQLVRTNALGQDEYGPQIGVTGAGWEKLQHAFDQADNAIATGAAINGAVDGLVFVTGHQTSGQPYSQSSGDSYILHDTDGNAWLFHVAPTLPTPGPYDPVIILDPQNGNQTDQDPDDAPPPWAQGGSGNSGGGDCVACESYLPDGRRAGDIEVGDTMELADQNTLERGSGVVSFSRGKFALGYRIATESGASLVCSDTAPIPVKDRGLMTPDCLLGEQVAVRWDEDGITAVRWETVVAVKEVGRIAVQHITVGDKCFWAGEKKGAYILHHNQKNGNDYGYGSSGTDNNNPWWWNDGASGESARMVLDKPGDNNATPHTPSHDVPIVGVPAPDAGILM